MKNVVKHIRIDPVGELCITKNIRSRRIRLRVGPDGKVLLSMPPAGSEQKALDFVRAKSDWILKQQSAVKAGLTVFEPAGCFRTRFHALQVIRDGRAKVSARVEDGLIRIGIPRECDCKLPGIQQFIRDVIVKVMQQEARVYLPVRLTELSVQHGFCFGKVVVKQVKTRWGSCSQQNNINLNLHLMRLPSRLTDYVLLHELVHTVEKNHGPGFWQLLGKICPGARELDRQLKGYRVDVF
ncbi:MAG: M48 family metallopeptidase [Mangrovibacterium sp.]